VILERNANGLFVDKLFCSGVADCGKNCLYRGKNRSRQRNRTGTPVSQTYLPLITAGDLVITGALVVLFLFLILRVKND
jgi:hypothetical protein